jgi:hypothetical protein
MVGVIKKINLITSFAVLIVTTILFNLINAKTAVYGQQVDGCDFKGYPLRYYEACANEGGFPITNPNADNFSWLFFIIDFLFALLPSFLFCWSVMKIKKVIFK